jgi:hypothetical protein
MKVTEKRKEIKVHDVQVTTDILCNKCGKSVCLDSQLNWMEGCEISPNFEYGSNKDGLIQNFHICDDCYDEFIGTFKYKPENF